MGLTVAAPLGDGDASEAMPSEIGSGGPDNDFEIGEFREVPMQCFHGKLLDGERVLFRRVSGEYEEDDGQGVRCGRLEVHEGSAPMLATRRLYRLVRDDGRSEEIFITGLHRAGRPGF